MAALKSRGKSQKNPLLFCPICCKWGAACCPVDVGARLMDTYFAVAMKHDMTVLPFDKMDTPHHSGLMVRDVLESINMQNACADHGQPVGFFCTRCNVGICNLCVSDSHRGHECKSVETVKSALLQTLEQIKVILDCEFYDRAAQRIENDETDTLRKKTAEEFVCLQEVATSSSFVLPTLVASRLARTIYTDVLDMHSFTRSKKDAKAAGTLAVPNELSEEQLLFVCIIDAWKHEQIPVVAELTEKLLDKENAFLGLFVQNVLLKCYPEERFTSILTPEETQGSIANVPEEELQKRQNFVAKLASANKTSIELELIVASMNNDDFSSWEIKSIMARKGCASVCRALGILYLKHMKEFWKACKWICRSEMPVWDSTEILSEDEARIKVAVWLFEGYELEQDVCLASELFQHSRWTLNERIQEMSCVCCEHAENAVLHGNKESQLALGMWFSDHGNKKMALKWLSLAAETYALKQSRTNEALEALARFLGTGGDGETRMYNLGMCFLKQVGDKERAIFWLERAAEKDDRAKYKLGKLLFDRDKERAVQLFETSASNGVSNAQLAFGDYLISVNREEDGIAWITKAAHNLSNPRPKAMVVSGKHYLNGVCGEINYEKALSMFMDSRIGGLDQWIEAASLGVNASKDNADANTQYDLAMRIFEGNVFTQNHAVAFEWFAKAANKGHGNAQYRLGMCFYNGYGVASSLKDASEWFDKAKESNCTIDDLAKMAERARNGYAAESGDTETQIQIAKEYITKEDTDFAEANRWLETAKRNGYNGDEFVRLQEVVNIGCNAENGSSADQYAIGKMYAEGCDVFEQNYSKAYTWLKKARDGGCQERDLASLCELTNNASKAHTGDHEGQYRFGMALLRGDGIAKDETSALEWLTKSSAGGNKNAPFELGKYHWDKSTDDDSKRGAMSWFETAAERKHAESQFIVGTNSLSGLIIPENPEKAQKMLTECMESGFEHKDLLESQKTATLAVKANKSDVSAQYQFGVRLLRGHHIDKNERRGFELVMKAFQKGNGDASLELARCYMNGVGTAVSFTQALRFIDKAKENGAWGEGLELMRKISQEGVGAEAGRSEAMHKIGTYFLRGYVVKKDEKRGNMYLQMAVKKDYEPSFIELGRSYLEGRGIERNLEEAKRLFDVVWKNGNRSSELHSLRQALREQTERAT